MCAEIIEDVYNDVLNRDEDVKSRYFSRFFKDKSHPNWADTVWILDVTGELPEKNEKFLSSILAFRINSNGLRNGERKQTATTIRSEIQRFHEMFFLNGPGA